MIVISLAEYVRSLKANNVHSLFGRATTCPHCHSDVASGILVRAGRKMYCPTCTPNRRRCASCGQQKPLTEFDVTKSTRLGFKIESYCIGCRQSKRRDQCHDAKDMSTPIAASATCSKCRKTKPRSHFYIDRRYSGGLMVPCKKCRLEIERAARRGEQP